MNSRIDGSSEERFSVAAARRNEITTTNESFEILLLILV
jgi:hypothetical protein